ncbi:MAG: SEC-C domain-containing protein [Ignavibacteriaceae bacterium]|jgi:hypothetical protein|nr:SEC-C domain-containing protein [Ignavibacteriaceae bacterium]
MWHVQDSDFFEKEKESILTMYPKLEYIIEDGLVNLSGELDFNASFENQEVFDTYLILIVFPKDYPDTVPESFEIGNKIPDNYHKNKDKSLCIAPPVDLSMKFSSNPCILNYINNLLIPYLYRYSFLQKYGKAPFEEYSHGALGLIEYYFEFLRVDSIPSLGKMLLIVLENKYRGHLPCPCGSNKKLRHCHGSKLKILSGLQGQQLQFDFINISRYLEENIKKDKGVNDESKRIIYNKG